MGRYKIVFCKPVAIDLRKIPKRDVQKILSALNSLSADSRPIGSEKLSGHEKYRIRRGDYRIIYEISDDEASVIVVKIGLRREACR